MSVLEAASFLTKAEKAEVADAISRAERMTSGELRVHLEDHIEEDVMDHAAFIFEELGMHRTRDRNGVLLYVAVADRRIAVIGDSGINARVPQGFWNDVVALLEGHFKADRRAAGLCAALERIGTKLSEFFPLKSDDTNELPNEVSIGDRRQERL
ncbi:MAG: TPM domain-containing protein [Flavobacteriales bacterium]